MAARAYNCLQGDLWASSNQQIRLSTQQFSRADKWAARILDAAIVNDNVLSLAEPILFQLRRKGLIDTRGGGCAGRPEKSYSGDFFNLLCASPIRPRQGRAAGNKANKIPPPHDFAPEAKTQHRTDLPVSVEGVTMSALRQKQTCAVELGMSALPPKADMCSARGDVCFGPRADIADFIRSRRRRGTGSTAVQKDRAPWPS